MPICGLYETNVGVSLQKKNGHSGIDMALYKNEWENILIFQIILLQTLKPNFFNRKISEGDQKGNQLN